MNTLTLKIVYLNQCKMYPLLLKNYAYLLPRFVFQWFFLICLQGYFSKVLREHCTSKKVMSFNLSVWPTDIQFQGLINIDYNNMGLVWFGWDRPRVLVVVEGWIDGVWVEEYVPNITVCLKMLNFLQYRVQVNSNKMQKIINVKHTKW